jgi:hypothetical protein
MTADDQPRRLPKVAAAVPAAVRVEHVSATGRRWDSGGYHLQASRNLPLL